MNFLCIALIVFIGHSLTINAMDSTPENQLIFLIKNIEQLGNGYHALDLCKKGIFSKEALELANTQRATLKREIQQNQPKEPDLEYDFSNATKNWERSNQRSELKQIIQQLKKNELKQRVQKK